MEVLRAIEFLSVIGDQKINYFVTWINFFFAKFYDNWTRFARIIWHWNMVKNWFTPSDNLRVPRLFSEHKLPKKYSSSYLNFWNLIGTLSFKFWIVIIVMLFSWPIYLLIFSLWALPPASEYICLDVFFVLILFFITYKKSVITKK